MKIRILKSFTRDLMNFSDDKMRIRIGDLVNQIEKADQFSSITNIKKLTGYKNCYRIRVGDDRIGIYFEAEEVIFARVLHRREVYKKFP